MDYTLQSLHSVWKKKKICLCVYTCLPKYAMGHFVTPGRLSTGFWNDASLCGGAILPSPKWQLDGCSILTEWDLHHWGHLGPLSFQNSEQLPFLFHIPVLMVCLYDFILYSHWFTTNPLLMTHFSSSSGQWNYFITFYNDFQSTDLWSVTDGHDLK